MGRPDPQNDEALIADGARRAGALRDALARDLASLTGGKTWPEGPALHADAIAAVERVIDELSRSSEPVPSARVPPPESPSS